MGELLPKPNVTESISAGRRDLEFWSQSYELVHNEAFNLFYPPQAAIIAAREEETRYHDRRSRFRYPAG